MKKSIIKITSTLLLANLISTSLYAATATLDENVAAMRITRTIRLSVDRKLNQLFDGINEDTESVTKDIKTAAPAVMQSKISVMVSALNESSDFKSMLTPTIFLLVAKNAGLDVDASLAQYHAYIEGQTGGGNLVRRQLAALVLSKFVALGSEDNNPSRLDTLQFLLGEALSSPYASIRSTAYESLAKVYKDCGDKDKVFTYYMKQFLSSPKGDHADIYERLADFDYSEDYKPKREYYLKKAIQKGAPLEKADALATLAHLYQQDSDKYSSFYRPSEALRIYESLLADPEMSQLVDSNSIHLSIASTLAWAPIEIADVERAIAICEDIRSRRAEVRNKDYIDAIALLGNIHLNKKPNHLRALNLTQEILNGDSSILEYQQKYLERNLQYLYQHGSEGIKDHQKLLGILENKRATLNPETPEYLMAEFSLANLLCTGDETIKNPARGIEIYENIILRTKGKDRENYGCALDELIRALDPNRAFNLCQEALKEDLPEHIRDSIEKSLISLYRYGPEGIRNHPEALRLLEEKLATLDAKDSRALSLQADLAHLFCYDDSSVKNAARAIGLYEELLEHKDYKFNALNALSYMYTYDSVLKNVLKAIEYDKALLPFYEDKPLEQLKILTKLLGLYSKDGEAFNIIETKATAEQILAHTAVDGTARLQVQVALSDLYARHPDDASIEEKTRVHRELSQNPMATPQNVTDACHRLIALHTEQGAFQVVVETYEQLLTQVVDWQRNGVINEFITFLENPENVAVANPERVIELRALLFLAPPPHEFTAFADATVQLPGMVGGFGARGVVDPYFSPEMIKNRKESLAALNGDLFDEINYQTIITNTISDIKQAITEYGSRDEDYLRTAEVAMEVFETGNPHSSSYRSAVNHLEYAFSFGENDLKTMNYGNALARVWARIKSYHNKEDRKDMIDLFIIKLAEVRDPDGHIVCEIGKLMRHFQAVEKYFPDIKATTLFMRSIFSSFAQQKDAAFDVLEDTDPLKILKAKCENISSASEFKVGEEAHWVQEQYRGKFAALEAEEQTRLNAYYEQIVADCEVELLRSRDVLSETEKAFAKDEVAQYLSMTWFM